MIKKNLFDLIHVPWGFLYKIVVKKIKHVKSCSKKKCKIHVVTY